VGLNHRAAMLLDPSGACPRAGSPEVYCNTPDVPDFLSVALCAGTRMRDRKTAFFVTGNLFGNAMHTQHSLSQ
jgi:hypothetical protein